MYSKLRLAALLIRFTMRLLVLWKICAFILLTSICTGLCSPHNDTCLPDDPSELAGILTSCQEFYKYYLCAEGRDIQFNMSRQWAEIVENMLDKCEAYISGSLNTDICLPDDPSKLARILIHCHEFYNYYVCAKERDIQFNRSRQWGEIVDTMLEKCKVFISDVKRAPELEIDLVKTEKFLKELIKPSGWTACNNFHAHSCAYSLRRLHSSPPPAVKRSMADDFRYQYADRRYRRNIMDKDHMLLYGRETSSWSQKDKDVVIAILDKTIDEMIRFLKRYDMGWTGPAWVRKFLLVLGICREDKTYCEKINSVHNYVVTKMRNTDFLEIILHDYIAPTLPSYKKAKDFIDSLVPLIRKETVDMVKEWAGAGDTSSLIRFIEHKMTVHTDIRSKEQQATYMKRLNKITESLNITPGNSSEIIQRFLKWWINAELWRIIGTKNLGRLWIAKAYSKTGNIYYTGLALVPPAFGLDLSYAFVFGKSVFILSHEIGHILSRIMVRSKAHVEGFYSYFRDCLIDEYGKAPIYFKGKKLLNGLQTYRENFADVIGLQLAWRSYQKYYWHRDTVPKASGFTKEQVFFAAVASSLAMCNSRASNQTMLEKQQEQNRHTLGENRLNLLMMQTPQFAKAFKCPIGSKMNPYKNCVKLLDLKTY